jgi:tricorn protease
MHRVVAALTAAIVFVTVAQAQADEQKPLLLQKPTLSKTHITFNFAGDLWSVPRDGGEAQRLTSDVGLEFTPLYSPDGQWIAFSGEYDGNIDVFVVSAKGGEPKRLTYHPGVDVAVAWTPDSKSVLFSSGRTSYSRYNKLFTIALEGNGFPTELPLPMGEQGSFSPDGTQLAYVPHWNRRAVPNAYIAWKRYRGGHSSPICIANLSDSSIVKMPWDGSSDHCPMWIGNKVYFLSDRDNQFVTLYSYDVGTKQVTKEIDNPGSDIQSASAGPDGIVYDRLGSLHLFNLQSKSSVPVEVKVTADFPNVRPRYDNVSKKINGAAISPTGARAVFQARGEILTVPAEKGDIRNLTQTTGACERDPAWSPDGKTIAYFSDESGDYQLYLRDARGTGEIKKFTLGNSPNFYFHPVWSPDSKKIAYNDNRNTLWFLDTETGKSTKVDAHSYMDRGFDAAWSPDSKWLAYTRSLDNKLRAAFLYQVSPPSEGGAGGVGSGKTQQITDGMSDVRHTAFDKSGKYLYFTASTDIGPTTTGIDMSGMNRPVTRSVYLLVLDKDLPSPFAPESDEEKEKPAAPTPPSPPGEKKEVKVKVDFDGIGQRILAMPLPARNYMGLQVGKAGTIFITEISQADMAQLMQGGQFRGATVTKFDLDTRKSDVAFTGVSSFQVSANGEKVLYAQPDLTAMLSGGGRQAPPQKWYIMPASGSPTGGAAAMAALAGGGRGGRGGAGATPSAAPSGDGQLKLDNMEVYVDPKAEWKQMYREAWRLQRDFLYDPGYHGLDLVAAEKQYTKYLDGLAHRVDLNYLFNDMLGELSLGHTYIMGGDIPDPKRVKGGLLGADFKIENDRYRFAKVFNGENWNPQLRAPLTQPGVNVKEGEYLLAVNGKNLTANQNLDKAFEATAGTAVIIKVGPNADGQGSREVTVVPVDSDTSLRNLAWIEGNRRKVDEMTGGKVAYVYLPDTGAGGYNNFNRYFFAQADKQAVILDERFNGGGKAADYIIEYLRRELLNHWTSRDAKIYNTPGGAIYGPKAMIINEFAGSGGDAMPWYFRKSKLGPLVGKRTWGGLVGISGYPPLLDGGSVTAPSFAFFSTDGTWDVENKGVAPDVEVDLDPYAVRSGRDPQLEKAVEIVMEQLKKNPPKEVKKPEYPNYHRKDGKGASGGGK